MSEAASAAAAAQQRANVQRRSKQRSGSGMIDISFFFLVIALLVLGMIMMFSASYAWGLKDGDGLFYIKRQLFSAGVGAIVMLVMANLNYRIWAHWLVCGGGFVVCVLLLIAVLLIGNSAGGAQRWLSLGPVDLQPSELMKAVIVLLFASIIERCGDKMSTFRYGILPYFSLMALVAVLMMMQPHLSGTIIICALGVTMMFVGGSKMSHLVLVGVVGVVALVAVVVLLSVFKDYNYFGNRIQCWLDPFNEQYMADETWQTCQSLIAIGSGGLFGMGLGSSRQKYLYLPESQNDFVFAIVCEELGFIGAVLVILLFAILVFRGFYIASKAKDKFGMMVAVGLTMHIGLQAFLNIAVVSNLIPNTGISLPFFSYGGTAIVMQMAEMGIILNISKHAMLEQA